MNDQETYQKLAGKVLRSSKLLRTKTPDVVESLQNLLEETKLEGLLSAVLKIADEEGPSDFKIFYEVFSKLLLRFSLESMNDEKISLSKDELLEVLRISIEEELYNL
ncbi:hypothetical protein N9O57_01675, partial [bacterium]|nr:hypothetical protein [bacterium]